MSAVLAKITVGPLLAREITILQLASSKVLSQVCIQGTPVTFNDITNLVDAEFT